MNSNNQVWTYSGTIGQHEIIIETGKLAGQADGAVTVRSGDTVVLVTATSSKEPREGADFLPLIVDYEERLYAAGKIPGSFFRREGRPSESAILLCRLADRPLRPLFPDGYRNEVQIIITALSADRENPPDILGIIGASAALTISDIPFDGPVGAVRVSLDENGEFIFNPTISETDRSVLDLRLAGTSKAISMIETRANEVDEETILAAVSAGHQAMQGIIELQNQMRAEIGKPKREYRAFLPAAEVETEVRSWLGDRLAQVMSETHDKEEREEALDTIRSEAITYFSERFEEADVKTVFQAVLKETARRSILEHNRRPDGRDSVTIRPVNCEVGLSPRAHGSGLFTRGATQVLTIATLGTIRQEQMLDGLSPHESKRYLHHYNFPPFSTGETWFLRGPKRREIGHGALAETALRPMIPPEEGFPYTIRLVSEVLSSNGSTSMASVCGSTLALMDAGVPIKAPVAGIAMGLVVEDGRHRVLSDIQGLEDAIGDMDFKVAGTRAGITALQLDTKTKRLDHDILREALAQAHEGRLAILDRMQETISEVRSDLSPYAPRITILKINPEKIGTLIGPGGKTIRRIIEETGVEIDVEDDGTVYVAAANGASSEKAIAKIELLTEEPEVGKIYTGKVVRITDFGAFVEILPGQDGLVHISQLADYHVSRVDDVVKVGDEIMVMITDIDREGKIRLSRQAVLEGWTPEEARARDRRTRPRGARPSRRRPLSSRGPRMKPRR